MWESMLLLTLYTIVVGFALPMLLLKIYFRQS
jgi:hypothetical protein